MAEPDDIIEALSQAPTTPVQGTLVRCVALQALVAFGQPDFLFASGKANRCNPAGVHCLYFSEDERTARAEYGRRLGLAGRQPLGTYFAAVKLARVLDLTDRRTCAALGIQARDLSAAWNRARTPTRTQLLGLAVSRQNVVSAIRFPSDAAQRAGFTGANLVIFRDVLKKPDFVKVLGPAGKPLQRWP